MVLKGIIRYIINRYLKNYIEQLDDEKLNYDLRNGHVTLENLQLKPEALVQLNLPVTVAAGYLEKLSLTVPWMSLYTRPTKVHISGLYILVVPKNEFNHDFSEYHANKMRRVQRKVDNLRKTMIENKKLEEKELTYFERIRLQMIQNIEITLENFHISYETKSTTKLGHPFSFGFTLHYLHLITENDKRTKSILYKVKQIKSLSIYWNTKCQSRVDLPFNIIIDNLKTNIPMSNSKATNEDINYILNPVDLNMDFVIMLTSGEHNYHRPTININCLIKELTLNIDSKQFSDLLDFGKFQNYSLLYERCREYRHLHFQQLIDDSILTDEEKDRLRTLESKLDVFNLAYIRHSVQIEIENDKRNGTLSQNKHSNRWNWWWKKKSKYNYEKQTSISKMEGFHNDGFSFYLEDIPNIVVDIQISKLYLNLLSSDLIHNRQIIAHVNADNGQINVTKRSISSSLLVIINLPLFQLFGLKGNREYSPVLIEPVSRSSSIPLMNIQFELFPTNTNSSDYRFHLNLQPMYIIYDAETFNRIVHCFEPNGNPNSFFTIEVKEHELNEMEEDLSCQKMFDMTIELQSISIVIPQNGFYQKNCSMINIHFDQLILKSLLDDHEKLNEERFYDKYKLEIKNLKMISYSDQSNIYLLEQIPLIDIDFSKCLYLNDLHLDDWKIHLKINTNKQIDILKRNFDRFVSLIESIPNFYPTALEIASRINLYFEIFHPTTSIQAKISMNQCVFTIENNQKIFISMDIDSLISKKRYQLDKIIFTFKNLIITMDRLSNPFYINQHLQLNYLK